MPPQSHLPPDGAVWRKLLFSAFPWLLGIAVFAVYLPCLNGLFVWDDEAWTTSVQPLLENADGLRRMWMEPGSLQQYYPLTGSTFWWDYQRFGYWTTPWHMENVALHIAAALLFWKLLRRLNVPGAWIACALFALHPMMVESVAWITERKNVLSQVLVLGAALAYGRYASWWNDESPAEPRRWAWYLLALLLFAAALFAKVTVLVLPPMLLLFAWWRRRAIRVNDVFPVIPFFLLAVAVAMVVMRLESENVGAQDLHHNLGFADRCLIAARALWFYGVKLLLPYKLSFVYPSWQVDTGSWWQWGIVVTTLAVVVGACVLHARIGRGALVAMLFFMGALAPVLGFVNVYGFRFSWVWDHWVYLPSLGFFAAIGALAARALEMPRYRRATQVGLALVLIGAGVQSSMMAARFAGPLQLWESSVMSNPDCWLAYHNVGEIRQREGRLAEAMALYAKALSIEPDLPEAHFNLGACHFLQGDFAAAKANYEQAVKLSPRFADAHSNLASAMLSLGDPNGAVVAFEKAVELHPKASGVRANLGVGLEACGRIADAVASYEAALKLDKMNTKALQRLAWIRATSPIDALRNGAAAVDLAKRANDLALGTDLSILGTLAAAFAEAGNFDDATATVIKAAAMAMATGDQLRARSLMQQKASYDQRKPWRSEAPGSVKAKG